MCNLYTHTRSADEIRALFAKLQMPLAFPEGAPNLPPRDIAITDPGPIVRAAAGEAGSFELVVRRWSWPGPGGRPVYNFRSEGREFPSGRCLILADGFYEFTTPADPKQKRKDRWLFTAADEAPIAIAGLVRAQAGVGEAFTMLTTEPGPDVAPYHGREVAVLGAEAWRAWLDNGSGELLRAGAAGTLVASAANRAG
ncbi:MAG: SOS response-associated peptidase [Sphingomicrobium sp.]